MTEMLVVALVVVLIWLLVLTIEVVGHWKSVEDRIDSVEKGARKDYQYANGIHWDAVRDINVLTDYLGLEIESRPSARVVKKKSK